MPNRESTRLIAQTLKSMGHPLRVSVIELLSDSELPVNEICEKLKVEQSLMSHHLNQLKLNGLLVSRRDGKRILYSIKHHPAKEVVQILRKAK